MDILIFDWSVKTIHNEDYVIGWAIDRNSDAIAVVIKGVYPEVIMRLPPMPKWYEKFGQQRFNQHRNDVIESLNISKTLYHGEPKLKKRRPQFYFSEGYPHLVYTARNTECASKIQDKMELISNNVFYNYKLEMTLIANRKLNSQGWNSINLDNAKLIEGIARIGKAYLISENDISPTDATYPVFPLCGAYDIETKGEDGRFSTCEFVTDYICAISYETWVYKSYASTVKTYTIIYGKVLEDKVPDNISLYCVDTEEELINIFERLIKDTSPVMITQYNGDGFDLPYIHGRKGRICQRTDWDIIGRDINTKATTAYLKPSMGGRFRKGRLLIAPGLVSADVFKYYMDGNKRRSYKLKDIGQSELNDTKKDIGDYKFINYACNENRKGNYEPMTTLLEYVNQDTSLTARLTDHINLFDYMVEMTQATSSTWQSYNRYGRKKRTESMMLVAATHSNPPIVPGTRVQQKMHADGGYVRDPLPGMYPFTCTFDFNSLYPSIMIGFNLDYVTLLSPEDSKLSFEQLMAKYPSIKSPSDIRRVLCEQEDGNYEYLYVKSHVCESLIPGILESLLNRRKLAKKAMETTTDPVLKTQYNIKQIALKISSNSVYGYTGAEGDTSCIEIEQSVTAIGRMCVKWLADKLKEFNANIVYGDTDSVMIVLLGCKNHAEGFERGNAIRDYLNKNLPYLETDNSGRIYLIPEDQRDNIKPKPLQVAFENQSLFLLIAKKNYSKVYVDPKTNDFEKTKDGEVVLHNSGITPEKRDKSIIHCEYYLDILKKIMNRVPFEQVLSDIYTIGRQIYYPSIPVEKFSFTRAFGKEKTGAGGEKAMKQLSTRLALEGKAIEVGQRFSYYYCDHTDYAAVLDTEYEDNRSEWQSYYSGGPLPSKKLVVDRYGTLVKTFNTMNSLLNIAYKREIAEYGSYRSKKLIIDTCKIMYLKHGRDFIIALSKSQIPAIAISVSDYAAEFKTVYNSLVKKRKIQQHAKIMEGILVNIESHSKVMEQLLQKA